VTEEASMLPLFASQYLGEVWRTIDATAVSLHPVGWYRDSKCIISQPSGAGMGKRSGFYSNVTAS
jgi:hypothetical protein